MVDDHADSAAFLELWLRDAGHDVQVTHSGAEALTATELSSPEIALIDIQMPDMDGLELCTQLRNKPDMAQCTFIAITAHAGPHALARSIAAGFHDHFTKPIEVAELLSTINRLPTSTSTSGYVTA